MLWPVFFWFHYFLTPTFSLIFYDPIFSHEFFLQISWLLERLLKLGAYPAVSSSPYQSAPEAKHPQTPSNSSALRPSPQISNSFKPSPDFPNSIIPSTEGLISAMVKE